MQLSPGTTAAVFYAVSTWMSQDNGITTRPENNIYQATLTTIWQYAIGR